MRTPAETNIALFWYPALNFAYEQILRSVLADPGHSLAWDARFVATFHVDHDRCADRDLQRQVQVRVLAPGHGDPRRERQSRPDVDTAVGDAQVP